MKSSGALALTILLAASGASFAQSGGGSAGGASSGGASTSSSGASPGAGAATSTTGAPVGAVPGATTSGPTIGAGITPGSPNAPAPGGVPTTPGGLNNQLQSNQNNAVGAGAKSSGAAATAPSTPGTGNPTASGSGRDEAARARTSAQCESILNSPSSYPADQVAACEKSTLVNDPAALLDRRLQPENSRAVNSICRGC